MELIAGALNKRFLETLVHKHVDDCAEVIAVVPYCDSLQLFHICQKADRPINFYCRLDHTVPVKSEVLKWFLEQANLNCRCYVLRGVLHAKIIWFRGVGAYIGSANLTTNGWVSNIEAGVFLTEEEMISDGVLDEVKDFVETVHEKSVDLTAEIFNLVTQLENKRRGFSGNENEISNWFNTNCGVPEIGILVTGRNRNEKVELQKNEFLKEWNHTLELMKVISKTLNNYRPDWVHDSVANGVHLDQFLHAYYYLIVREGNSQPYEKHHELNKNNPNAALESVMKWWKNDDYPHANESEFMHRWAPRNSELLKEDKILTLTEVEFVELCSHVHAIGAYGVRQKNELLGLSSGAHEHLVRVEAFGRWLYQQKSKENKTVLETINYVLYGSSPKELPLRLWNALSETKWKINGLGVSSLGELVGWAMPDAFPPRNSRTSKALKALGNKVKVHSEA